MLVVLAPLLSHLHQWQAVLLIGFLCSKYRRDPLSLPGDAWIAFGEFIAECGLLPYRIHHRFVTQKRLLAGETSTNDHNERERTPAVTIHEMTG